MTPHIQVRNLNAWYNGNQALKDINIEIPKQQITVIMGPSGCGKTTLLKTFNRFLELTDSTRLAGEVLVDGQNIYERDVDVTEVRKLVGLLAQRPSPLPMSIYDNVVYGMRIHRTKKDRRKYKNAVRHYLELAGLWDEVGERLRDPHRLVDGDRVLARTDLAAVRTYSAGEPLSGVCKLKDRLSERKGGGY